LFEKLGIFGFGTKNDFLISLLLPKQIFFYNGWVIGSQILIKLLKFFFGQQVDSAIWEARWISLMFFFVLNQFIEQPGLLKNFIKANLFSLQKTTDNLK